MKSVVPLVFDEVRHHSGCDFDTPVQEAEYMSEGSAPPTIGLSRLPAAAKVLLVDDDYAILNGISDFLESEGFSVVLASNGIDALNKLRSGLRVDVIVLDVLMPIMDGW